MIRNSLIRTTVAGVLVLAACGGEKGASPAPDSAPAGGTAATATPASSDPRAAIFIEKGCPQCHSISALGVKSPAEIGPDLTIAYGDVQTRFNMKLEEFLKNPTGTMQIVLGSQIKLTPAERDSIVELLEDLHEEANGGEEE